MKKAILNLGLLSMMMMLTSFTSMEVLPASEISYHSDNKGIYISPDKKQDYVRVVSIDARNFVLSSTGQVINNEKKVEL